MDDNKLFQGSVKEGLRKTDVEIRLPFLIRFDGFV